MTWSPVRCTYNKLYESIRLHRFDDNTIRLPGFGSNVRGKSVHHLYLITCCILNCISVLSLYRVWTTSEYPVFGWTKLDPRLMTRRENRLRTVYHIEVNEDDRANLLEANRAIRQVTGRVSNAAPVSEII